MQLVVAIGRLIWLTVAERIKCPRSSYSVEMVPIVKSRSDGYLDARC